MHFLCITLKCLWMHLYNVIAFLNVKVYPFFFFPFIKEYWKHQIFSYNEKDTIKWKAAKAEEEKFKQLSSIYLHLCQNDAKDKDGSFRRKSILFHLGSYDSIVTWRICSLIGKQKRVRQKEKFVFAYVMPLIKKEGKGLEKL